MVKPIEFGDSANPHTLRLIQSGTSTLCAMQVNKPTERQSLAEVVPATTHEIESAWELQGGWLEVVKEHDVIDEDFFAIRIIELQGGCLVWIVDHLKSIPADVLIWWPGADVAAIKAAYDNRSDEDADVDVDTEVE